MVDNAKVQVRIDDGRHYLQTTKERFDAITADPLDPWVKGAANLYTKEFFEEVKRHLNPGGVVTMYMQLFENNAEAVKSSVATFLEVFPNGNTLGQHVRGQRSRHGAAGAGRTASDRSRRNGATPGPSGVRYGGTVAREVGMNSPVDLFATYAGRRSDLTEWLRGAVDQSRSKPAHAVPGRHRAES